MAHPVRVKTATGWQDLALQGAPGPTGPAGTPGEKWFTGAGAPAGGTGAVADWYLDGSSGDFYEKTGASSWTLRGNLKGPQGIQGIQGPVGVAEQWWSGAGAPSGITGVIGDWYLNTTSGDVSEKTGTSTWTLRANIIGPPGATGATGPTGQAEGWLSGAGAPAGGTGSVGDWYLDTTAAGAGSGDVYEKTGASTWTLRANIKGPTGAPGSGAGVAAGGATNSILKKNSGTDFDTGWTSSPTLAGLLVSGSGKIEVASSGEHLRLTDPASSKYLSLRVGAAGAAYGAGYPDAPLEHLFRYLDGGYAAQGIHLANVSTGAELRLHALASGSLYITSAAGAPGDLTIGSIGNPNDGSALANSYLYWYLTPLAAAGNSNKFGIGMPPVENLDVKGSGKFTGLVRVGSLGVGPAPSPNEQLEISANVAGSRVGSANLKMSYSASPDAYANFIRNVFSGTPAGHIMEFVLKQNSVEHTLLTLSGDDKVTFGGTAIFGSNVGINLGGVSPLGALHVAGGPITNGPLLVLSYTDTNYRSIIKGTWSGSSLIGNVTTYFMRTGIDATERPIWTARADGKLGIGTQTNPARELDVIGDTISDSLILRPRSAAPTPTGGQLYYDSGTSTLYWYDGTTWVSARGGATPNAAAISSAATGDVAATNVQAAIAELAAEKVAMDSVVAAATRLVANKLLAGDANAAFSINGLGAFSWGAGGASAPDLSFNRRSAGLLRVAGSFEATGSVTAAVAGSKVVIGSDGVVTFGATPDVNLYRAAADVLKTDDTFDAFALRIQGTTLYNIFAVLDSMNDGHSLWLRNGSISIDRDATPTATAYGSSLAADTWSRFMIDISGKHTWGSGAGALDTNLYRAAVDVLKTDDAFEALVASAVQTATVRTLLGGAAAGASSPNTYLGLYYDIANNRGELAALSGGVAWRDILVALNAKLLIGGADVNLYRSAADVLKTDDTFDAAALLIGGAAIGTILQARSEKGAANGYASLDAGARVPDASLPGRLATGSQTGGITVADWNDAITSGWYDGNGAANAPAGQAGWLQGEVTAHRGTSPQYVTQRVWTFTDGSAAAQRQAWQRQSVNGVWQAWALLDFAPTAGVPTPVVNGQWVKGVGGVAVWAKAMDYSSSASVSAANVDVPWSAGESVVATLALGGSGGSVRSIGTPPSGNGTRLTLYNNAGPITLKNALSGGSGSRIATRSSGDVLFNLNEVIELVYMFSAFWQEVGRDLAATWQTGDTKVSAKTATHADPQGGTWYLADGSGIPAAETGLQDLLGVTFPDARGRGLVMLGTHADVNGYGKNEGVATVANRRQKHQTSKTDPGHFHGSASGRQFAVSGGGSGNLNSTGAGTYDTNTDSKATGITVGTGVATDPVDSGAYVVVGNLFYHS